jgi:SAM-dependent methyltransferase
MAHMGDLGWFIDHLVDPETRQALRLEGDRLLASDGREFPIRGSIPRFVGDLDAGQAQTADAFAFKWAKTDAYDSSELRAFTLSWLLERYGFDSPVAMRTYFEARAPFLDLGCGSGLTASLWIDGWRDGAWVGVDISSAIDVAKRRLPAMAGVHLVQADLMALPFRAGTFQTVFSEGVLHHTPSTKAALAAATEMLAPGGEIHFYVYRRKPPIREFTDYHVRERLRGKSPEEAWEALKSITELGRELARLSAFVELKDGVPLLGIPAGRHDVQRLVYWNIAKVFWNESLTFDANNYVNFDWYTPTYSHRQTEEEVRNWCADLGLTIERLHVDDAGFTVRARSRPGR